MDAIHKAVALLAATRLRRVDPALGSILARLVERMDADAPAAGLDAWREVAASLGLEPVDAAGLDPELVVLSVANLRKQAEALAVEDERARATIQELSDAHTARGLEISRARSALGLHGENDQAVGLDVHIERLASRAGALATTVGEIHRALFDDGEPVGSLVDAVRAAARDRDAAQELAATRADLLQRQSHGMEDRRVELDQLREALGIDPKDSILEAVVALQRRAPSLQTSAAIADPEPPASTRRRTPKAVPPVEAPPAPAASTSNPWLLKVPPSQAVHVARKVVAGCNAEQIARELDMAPANVAACLRSTGWLVSKVRSAPDEPERERLYAAQLARWEERYARPSILAPLEEAA